jgi:hypothetical protein
MSKTTLVFFWVIWLLDVLMALFGYREFITGVFGQYAAPNSKYVVLWTVLLVAIMLILFGSLYFKNHERPSAALIVAAIPLVLALPYALFMAAVLISGNNRWN